MTRKILHLPGTNCMHFLRNHCLLEEWRNPGLHCEWQCKMLVEWENEYDKFLTQAENFNLEMGMATKIWEQRLGCMMTSPSPCDFYDPESTVCNTGEETVEENFCRHIWLNLCILELPLCCGVCQHFRPKSGEDECLEDES